MSLFEDAIPAGFPPPRAFQVPALRGITEGILAGHKNQMLMAPTGAGKTYLGLRIAHSALRRGKRATFLCDRTTLIDQTSERACTYGMDHSIIQADHPMEDWSKPFQIASIQTIEKRGWPKTDVLIVDEAHTTRDEWVKFAKESEARVIGLSATPFTRGLGQIFTNLVNPTTMHELTQTGVLVPMRVMSCRRPDMTGAKTNSQGEWATGDAGERGMEIIGDVVSEWLRHADNRKTIVFGTSIAHCEELCRQFNEAGVFAATFTTETEKNERRGLKTEFERPDSALRVLISVEALAKGFDVQDVGCVVDCRPLRKSLSLAIQMWGRGLRSSPETGKQDCLLLDHSGNITRFAEDFTSIYFDGLSALDMGEQLDRTVRREEREEREITGCPRCTYKPFRKRCMSCGFEIQDRSLVAHEAGVMEEVVIGKNRLADSKSHLWNQLVAYANASPRIERKESFAKAKFKEWTGEWPPRSCSYGGAPATDVTEAVRNRITAERIRHAKARAAA